MPVESNLAESHGSAFDVAVRVARLGLESSGEGVETMERYVARVARAYGVAVDTVVLPESVIITDVSSGETDRVSVVRATPGIFRLDQLVGLKEVLGEVELGLPAEAACSRLDAVHAAPRLWPWWARVAGVALFAAGSPRVWSPPGARSAPRPSLACSWASCSLPVKDAASNPCCPSWRRSFSLSSG